MVYYGSILFNSCCWQWSFINPLYTVNPNVFLRRSSTRILVRQRNSEHQLVLAGWLENTRNPVDSGAVLGNPN